MTHRVQLHLAVGFRFRGIVLQNSKVVWLQIYRENTKQEAIADSYNLSHVTEVACKFSVGGEVPHIVIRKSRLQDAELLITSAKRLLQHYRGKADLARCPLPSHSRE